MTIHHPDITSATVPESKAELRACLECREWRLDNLYWIKSKKDDDSDDHDRVKFKMNPAQRRLYDSMHGRDLILKARQLGFTTFIQIFCLDAALFTANTNIGIIAHNKDDASAFFKDKVKYAYDNLSSRIKAQVSATNDSMNELRFTNGSVLRVGTSLRSGTYHILHISEYGKLCAKTPERASEVKTGAMPTVPKNGTIFIESTAEGRAGHFFELAQAAKNMHDLGEEPGGMEYKFHFEPWWHDPGYSTDDYVFISEEFSTYFEELRAMDIDLTIGQKQWYIFTSRIQGDKMKREYPSTPEEAFEASVEGAYFSRQMARIRSNKQITRVPIVPNHPILTFWDLGRDTTSIWFFQKVGFEYRFVDYYSNSGEGMEFYVGVLKDRKDGGEPYSYGPCYLPHDGTNKSISADRSPAEVLYNNGFEVEIVPRTPAKDISIERARGVLPLCYFDKELCIDGLVCLDGYQKAWDDKNGVWSAKPMHNAASHGADAFMQFSDGFYHETQVEEEVDFDIIPQGRNATTGY